MGSGHGHEQRQFLPAGSDCPNNPLVLCPFTPVFRDFCSWGAQHMMTLPSLRSLSALDSALASSHRLESTSLAVVQVICSLCDTEQDVQQFCSSCGVCMGQYFCGICKFFDDDVSRFISLRAPSDTGFECEPWLQTGKDVSGAEEGFERPHKWVVSGITFKTEAVQQKPHCSAWLSK